MFVPDFNKSIPGYTGHRQTQLDESEDQQQCKEPRKQIPGKYYITLNYFVTQIFYYRLRWLYFRS